MCQRPISLWNFGRRVEKSVIEAHSKLQGDWKKWTPISLSGGWFNIKMSSYQYRKSHCRDKTILRPSYLHNGISYTGKMTSLYWIRALHFSGRCYKKMSCAILKRPHQSSYHNDTALWIPFIWGGRYHLNSCNWCFILTHLLHIMGTQHWFRQWLSAEKVSCHAYMRLCIHSK